MKHLIILGDGMADWAVPQLGGKTLLEYAATPHLDWLAQHGRNGLLKTVPDGFHPGSEVANSSILGYDQHIVYEGRGPLEAASIGVELDADDLAMRCNLVCLEGDLLKNHSCGRLETEEADVLIRFLQEKLGNDRIHFYTGVQYRHLLVIKGGNKHINCTPPHDIPLKPWRDYLPKEISSSPTREGAKGGSTAQLLNDLILKSQELLKDHPLNIQRQQRGMDPANSIWPWGGGYRPRMVPLTTTYPQIKRGSVITAVDLIRGIGKYAGLRVLDVEGATGLWDTNYEGKAEAAIQALREGDDFVYVHVEASDEAGHDGDLQLKLQTIENLDNRLVRPILEALPTIGEEVAIAVLPDHPTPISLRTHTAEPIPFCIYYPGIKPDSVQSFSENAAKEGSYGLLQGNQFIELFMR
jgi:2,3-bisphosphoglycerate-independent phosphoglycerate mutase